MLAGFAIFGTITKLFSSFGSLTGFIGIAAKYILDFLAWYFKEFYKGLGIILSNLSTLTVILALMWGSAYYFRTWDNDKVYYQCLKQCPTAQPTKVHKNKVKEAIYGPTALPPKKEYKPLFPNPFGGN